MAPLEDFTLKKVLFLLILVLLLFTTTVISVHRPIRRSMLEVEADEPLVKKPKLSSSSSKNSSKVIKSIAGSSKNQTKLVKSTVGSTKNQTKIIKSAIGSTKNQTKLCSSKNSTTQSTLSVSSFKSQIMKLNSTSTKPSNSTKTSKPINTKETKTKAQLEKGLSESKSKNPEKTQSKKAQKQIKASWIDEDDEEDDLVSGLRELPSLPSKFQETLLPDLEKISQTSQVYLSKYNTKFTKGFKPYVGKKYAPIIASIASFAFILIPLVLVFLIFSKIKAYCSLQKLLIFIQAYLAIYFSILCISSLVTGLEPVKFFYATSQSTFLYVQVLQSLGYMLYLLLLLMHLILVFSTETGLATKLLGLGQTFVGFAVGLHCYMTVSHRAVLHQPPKTSWKVHALYATCFLVICLLGTVDRRKKAYVEDDGEEGKKS